MFNMINARKVEDEYNVFEGLFRSNIFWIVWVIIVGAQVGVRVNERAASKAGEAEGRASRLERAGDGTGC